MTAITRFAPSPTGHIHIGNARTALINAIFARQHGGRFILRFDDTDTARSKREFAEAISRDLDWLGISPDAVFRQSERTALHEEATRRLREAGLLYPCYETPEQLERQRKRLAMRGLPPVYDRSALKLTKEERAVLEADGRKPHWRFLLPNHDGDPFSPRRSDVTWTDLVRGEQVIDLASMSDPVLIREDGSWLYTLPSVADDIEMGITHVIRGDDHVTNTGAQIAIFRALGAEPPRFGHHNLLTTASGEGLSKRLGSLSIGALREDGFEPMAIASLATLIGTSGPVEALASIEELAARFDISQVTRSAAKFDVGELETLNARLVHDMPFDTVSSRLAALGIGADNEQECDPEAFWLAVRGNLGKLTDATFWWQRLHYAEPQIEEDDREFLAVAASLLPEEPWDGSTWQDWTSAIKAETGRKGRALFMPLRLALTGESHGPELAGLLPLIGRERTLARLRG